MKQQKAPIEALTSLRFFLILYIVNGHFVQVATRDESFLVLFKQHNMIVGAFFILSGYLLTYAYSFFNSEEIRPMKPGEFFLKRLVRLYPPYLFVLILFAPMFIYIEIYYKHGAMLPWHALSVLSLTQAWIPSWGTLWNSPTWFLSAIVFCSAIFPWILQAICRLSRKRLFWGLGTILFLAISLRVVYALQSSFWQLEGIKAVNLGAFNLFRFNPLINSIEFLSGIFAARIFMTAPAGEKKTHSWTPTLLCLSLVSVILLRFVFPVNDLIVRSVAFSPLFLCFIYALHKHRESHLFSFLSWKPFQYMGEISFSIYILHGAIGQLFYKKLISSQLFAEPPSLLTYYIVVFSLSIPLYHFVEKPAHRYLLAKLNNRSIKQVV